MAERHPLALVLGGGAQFGIAYGCGVVDALVDVGLPLADAPVLGTSAGSWVGAGLRLGVGFDRLAELTEMTRSLRPGQLPGLATAAFGDRTCPGLTTSAVRFPTLRHELLDAAVVPVPQAIAASSAVPGLFTPARVGAYRYADGGLRSPTSADRAPAADVLLVIAPMAGPVLPPLGQALEAQIRREMRRWQSQHHGAVVLLRPTASLAASTWHPRGLFRTGNLPAVYAAARTQAESWLRTGAAATLWPLATARAAAH